VLVQGLKPHAEDAEFRKKWAAIKYHNKERLAGKIKEWTGVTVPVGSLYDVHIKRIHEYKRQYMNMISIIYRYKKIKARTCGGPLLSKPCIIEPSLQPMCWDTYSGPRSGS
jgi:starch phosphorylase